jgi:hypothetical protein
MKYRKLNKKGQTELSFGMIFSIIMIVGILSFGGYIIWKFTSFNECTESANLIRTFQEDINRIYYGSGGSYTPASGYSLSAGKKMICLIDTESTARGENEDLYDTIKAEARKNFNLLFDPFTGTECGEYKITHIDLQKSTAENNPLCFENKNGRVKITMIKNYGENLVTLS